MLFCVSWMCKNKQLCAIMFATCCPRVAKNELIQACSRIVLHHSKLMRASSLPKHLQTGQTNMSVNTHFNTANGEEQGDLSAEAEQNWHGEKYLIQLRALIRDDFRYRSICLTAFFITHLFSTVYKIQNNGHHNFSNSRVMPSNCFLFCTTNTTKPKNIWLTFK